MILAWATEVMDHGLTGLVGCYLFWALGVVKFDVAFSGFADDTPWFLMGAILFGTIASKSGLARRLAYLVMRRVGTSFPRILLTCTSAVRSLTTRAAAISRLLLP